jgi:hypothetical protein
VLGDVSGIHLPLASQFISTEANDIVRRHVIKILIR